MEVPGLDSDWRSQQFRQRVVAQIEDAMRKASTAHSKSSTDMENEVYIKAKSRIRRTWVVVQGSEDFNMPFYRGLSK